MEISSLTNSKVKNWAKLKEKKHRDKERLFLVEGAHLLEEAFQAGCLETLIILQGSEYPVYADVPIYEVTKEIIQKLTSLTSLETMIGVCHIPEVNFDFKERVVILDGVQDPGNLGTIIRTALSFGYEAVILSMDCVDVYNEKVIRSTQGAFFHFPVLRTDLQIFLPHLKQQGFTIYTTALHTDSAAVSAIQPRSRYALVFGNEGNGVKQETMSLSDHLIKIEMETFESLNVAVAAAICMYKFRYF